MPHSEEIPQTLGQQLTKKMTANTEGPVKVVHFANDDVPAYLVGLDKFEEMSKKSPSITIR